MRSTTHGAQPGGNHTGDYNCWNRIYNPHTGRWTTPDPAASPWWNLWDYVGNKPASRADPTGLKTCNFYIYDETEKRDELLLAWKAGAALHDAKHLGYGQFSAGAKNWNEAFAKIKKYFNENDCDCIGSIEFVGHGSAGAPAINGVALDLDSTDKGIQWYKTWFPKKWCDDAAGVWFRSCEVAQGATGKEFMKKATEFFGSKVSGHTHYIGINQPGKKTLGKGEDPDWEDDEGTDAWVDPAGFVHKKGRNERKEKGKTKEARLPENTEGQQTKESKKGAKKSTKTENPKAAKYK